MNCVLVVGVAVLDFVFHMQEFPRRPEKYRAEGASITGGGNAANAAVAIARLGGEAHLAARLGDDQIADLIVAELKQECVRTGLMKRHGASRSSFSSIYIDARGERQIMNYRDNSLPSSAEWVKKGAPANIGAVLADTRWPEGALAAMQLARSRGIPGILDAEAPVLEAAAALQEASHIAFSAQGVRDYAGKDDIREAALHADRNMQGRVLVTDGENGVVRVEDGSIVHTSSFDITPVDTLGAGDVWHGAFALGLAEAGQGQTSGQKDVAGGIEDAVRFSNAAAAIKCSRPDGRNGAPKRKEVTAFLRQAT